MTPVRYCNHSDVKNIYPHADEFDTKTSLYGWVKDGSIYTCSDSGAVSSLFKDGKDLSDKFVDNVSDLSTDDQWHYDYEKDEVSIVSRTDVNNFLMESGKSWSVYVNNLCLKASSYLDSRIDGNVPRRQFKNSDGTYDYLIIRTASLITVAFLIKAHDPTSAILEKFEEEYNFNIDLINEGKAKLSYQVSGDSSKGVVKEVDVQGSLKIVDTRGNYQGTYDRLKVIVSTAGVIGTARYDVFAKNSDSLKADKIINAEIINGDYQQLASGLKIRFQGVDDSSKANAEDEWEIEVFGMQESLDDNIGAVTYTSMTRSNRPFRKSYGY